RQQEQGGQPFRERELAALENGLDRHRELLAAGVALVDAGAVGLALKLGHVLGGNAAVRADWAMGPNPSLKPFAGEVIILENRVLQVGGHGGRPFWGQP